jgi:hypothetical protein
MYGAVLVIAIDFAFVITTDPVPALPPLTGTSGAVMDVRIYTGDTMYFQTKHGRPLIGGYLSRPVRSARAFYRRDPCVAWLMYSSNLVSPCDHDSMGRALADLNVTDVFVNLRDRRQPELIRLGFRQSYLDSRSSVWVPPAPTEQSPGGR